MHTQPHSNGEDRMDEKQSTHSGICTDSEDTSIDLRYAVGLLLHKLPGADDYVRVGVWESSVADAGGTAIFGDMDEREIDIV